MGYRVVVVGATGNVGREMLSILYERQFQVDEIAVLASRRSLGTEVSFGDNTLVTKDLETFDFSGWDLALFAIGSDGTKKHAPRAASAGCVKVCLLFWTEALRVLGLHQLPVVRSAWCRGRWCFRSGAA